NEAAFSWWTWWVGDTIGAFLVAPLVLLWANRRAPEWPRRPVTVSVPLGVMAALVVALFVYTSARERDRVRAAFELHTDTLTRSMKDRLDDVADALRSFRGFPGSTSAVGRSWFVHVAQGIAAREAAVEVVSWDPRVTSAERAAFEAARQGDDAPAFRIVE